MKIYEGLTGFKRLDHAVVTSGTFDGVHLGHQKILRRLVEEAGKSNGESVLITFWPHPRMVLNNNMNFLQLLNTMEEKQQILRDIGIHHLVLIPFTKEFAETSSADFIKKVLVDSIGTRKLIIGYNHRFGKNREGSFESLKENAPTYGFEIEEIPRHEIDHIGISSTKIRQALTTGDVETAERYLGRPYSLTGLVSHGEKLGRKIGYPTANIIIEETYKLIPANGVYAVKVHLGKKQYSGMLNIGFRPTVKGKTLRIEVHVFDFNMEIYDQRIRLDLKHRIRSEKSFSDLDELSDQLTRDKESSLKLLKKEEEK